MDQERILEIKEKLTLPYIAGFFDGEGSITVTRDCALQVCVSQNEPNILFAISGFFGCGSISMPKLRRGHKQGYTLRWCGKNAEKVLASLIDYLVVKKAQAELGLKLSSMIGYRGSKVSETVWKERRMVAQEIKNLNDSHWSRRPVGDASVKASQEEYIQ